MNNLLFCLLSFLIISTSISQCGESCSTNSADEQCTTGANSLSLELYLAVAHNLESTAKKIIADNPGLVNKPNELGFTPLHAAAAQGHESLIVLLAESDAQLNPISETGLTPIHLSARNNKIGAFIRLLQLGADPLLKTSAKSVVPLADAFTINQAFTRIHRMEIATFNNNIDAVSSYLREPLDPEHIIDSLKLVVTLDDRSNQLIIMQTLLQYHTPLPEELTELVLLASSSSNPEVLSAILSLKGHTVSKKELGHALTNAVLAFQAQNVQLLLERNAPTSNALDAIKACSTDKEISLSDKNKLADIQELITSLRPQSSNRLTELFASQRVSTPRISRNVLRKVSSDDIRLDGEKINNISLSSSVRQTTSATTSPVGSPDASDKGTKKWWRR